METLQEDKNEIGITLSSRILFNNYDGDDSEETTREEANGRKHDDSDSEKGIQEPSTQLQQQLHGQNQSERDAQTIQEHPLRDVCPQYLHRLRSLPGAADHNCDQNIWEDEEGTLLGHVATILIPI